MFHVFERLRRMMPDRCQARGCDRSGVRGEEEWVDGIRMCASCRNKRKMTRFVRGQRLERIEDKVPPS